MSQLEDFSSNFISNSWDVHKLKSLRDVFNKRSVEDRVKKYGRVWKCSRSIYMSLSFHFKLRLTSPEWRFTSRSYDAQTTSYQVLLWRWSILFKLFSYRSVHIEVIFLLLSNSSSYKLTKSPSSLSSFNLQQVVSVEK